MAPLSATRGHIYKAVQERERIVNIWNNVPDIVDFGSVDNFVRSVKLADLPDYLEMFFRNELHTSVGCKCLQSYVVYVF